MSINRQALQEQHNSQMVRVKNSGMLSNYNSGSPLSDDKEEEMTRSALSTFRQKEEEIEKKKSQVRERVQAQLGRVEEETKRLAVIREELEALEDPLRKEVSLVRKRIDLVNRDLKSLGQSCLKKEKEYREVFEAYNDKNKEKSVLLSNLMELVGESEKLRMKKLEELSKNIESLQ
ncbi:hypothetical protein Leryth_019181 [Lithospermum erythrorhizon]|uniref:RAB6-interacting golgin n=1 Tax=Lithospermum erythrorhizon TaxID=34254 RepID=A0AAV3NQT0_LITER|nr:hypothetical protein Leryth_019181 [Lithospermum erythrorhizon]